MPNKEDRRLRRKPDSQAKALKISERKVFGICEGRSFDPYVYSELMKRAFPTSEQFFQINRVEEIAGLSGKKGIMQLLQELRSRKALATEFKGKNFCCVFFMDKDIDDICNKRFKSSAVFYTDAYDLEGQLYRDSNLHRAVAVGLQAELDLVPTDYQNAAKWISDRAFNWHQWLILCIFSEIHQVDAGCSFGRTSVINQFLIGPTDHSRYLAFKNSLKVKSGLSAVEFDQEFQVIENLYEDLIRRGVLWTVFKGKWLEAILEAELKSKLQGKLVNFNGLGARVSTAVLGHFDAQSLWARKMITRLNKVITKVLKP